MAGCFSIRKRLARSPCALVYLYRAYKENVSEAQIDRLKEKLYSGTATRADVTRVTKRLGDEIGRVYGWRFPPVREAARER